MRRPISRRKRGNPLLVRLGLAIALGVLLTVFRSTITVESASFTGATEKLKITGGVLTVAPGGSGDSMLEIGNYGREISSTGPIYFRPNGTTAGTRFVGNAGDNTQDLLLTGDLNVDRGISLGGVYRTTWPPSDYWTVDAGNNLTPVAAQYRLQTPYAYNTMFEVYSNATLFSANQGLRVTNSGGPSVDFRNNTAELNDNLFVIGNVSLCPFYDFYGSPPCQPGYDWPVWTPDNDGVAADGSGPDADTIDGVDTYVVDACGGVGNVFCFCESQDSASNNQCQLLYPWVN